ncbi:26S proteasome regulatory subunit N9 [Pancytospora epiphaga]|nr:26S proteasome regulatory subunit N9 [Pancytospora epiphaga]
MAFAELENLLTSRKWYDFAEHVEELVKKGQLSSEDATRVRELMEPILLRFHPHTAAHVSVVLASLLSKREAIELLEKVERVISDNMSDDVTHANSLIHAQMHLCAYRIENGEYEGREPEILGWFKIYDTEENEIPFSKENYTFLQYTAYSFYKKICNFDLAQKYLLRYITDSSDFILLEELVEFSIVSESFFNFSAVSLLDEFTTLEDKELVELFTSFNHGDVEKVTGFRLRIIAILEKLGYSQDRDDYLNRIIEKAYLINILNICFSSTTNMIPFDTFVSGLGLTDYNSLISLLLKALGHGLISGYIDSKLKCLFFSRLVPRALGEKDLADMKVQFGMWRDRVSQVIKLIELNKFAS